MNLPKLSCICMLRSYAVPTRGLKWGNRRKFIDREKESELPIFQYPKSKSTDRRVYVWGLAETGALGIQMPASSSSKSKWNNLSVARHPSRLSFAEKIDVSHITSGYGFTAVAVKGSDRYKVFGTGINTDSQIGYHSPKIGHPLEALLSLAPISLPLKSMETKIIGLSAGRAHLLILTDNEGVFSLGNNAYGQCGRRININEAYIGSTVVHNIKKCGKEKVVAVETGQDHSMFLTESGKVYACGWSADGQTGLGKFESEWVPSEVQGDIKSEKIVKLASSVDCVLALNDRGEVFAWGNSEYGQIPQEINPSQQINTSTSLNHFLKGIGKIVDIATGGSFCLVVNEYGDVFVWGFGLLGLGPKVQHSVTPQQIPAPLFGRNEFNPNSKVTKITAGIGHMAAVTNNGDLYMWGRNRHGCLGLGQLNDQYFPLKTSIGAHVLEVSCGVDHTVVLCKPFV